MRSTNLVATWSPKLNLPHANGNLKVVKSKMYLFNNKVIICINFN